MDLKQKTKQFFEQIKEPITAAVIVDAVRKTGYIPELEPVVLAYAEAKGIDVQKELAELAAIGEKARAEKELETEREKAAVSIASLAAEYEKADQDTRKKLIDSIQREAITLNKTITSNKIFPILNEIIAEWDSYDPEKDFYPPLFGGVAIKDGTLSYIGSRTGIGKTTILINITREALTAGRKVIFLTLEEPTRDLLQKIILNDIYATANKADQKTLMIMAQNKSDLTADFHIARRGRFIKGDNETALLFKKLMLPAKDRVLGLYGTRLVFCEGRSIKTLEETSDTVIKHAKPGDVVLVDYTQRLKCPAGTDYTNYLRGKAQSESLFTIAKETGAMVIAGAQFNRATKDNIPHELAPIGYKPFDETCFREAGDVEQDGDYLFGIGENVDADNTKRYIKILKVRSGSGRGRCYEIDFQGAYNYMGIGERLTKMNLPNVPIKNLPKISNSNEDDNREGWSK
jgi:KaiC/GvpD/RAD55 family RecA-like ATPase